MRVYKAGFRLVKASLLMLFISFLLAPSSSVTVLTTGGDIACSFSSSSIIGFISDMRSLALETRAVNDFLLWIEPIEDSQLMTLFAIDLVSSSSVSCSSSLISGGTKSTTGPCSSALARMAALSLCKLGDTTKQHYMRLVYI